MKRSIKNKNKTEAKILDFNKGIIKRIIKMTTERKGKYGIYGKFKCRNKSHPPFHPAEHQRKTVDYFLKSKYKGLLLFHKLGSGKTCSSIMIADKMLRQGKVKKVFVLTPGSLRSGWLTEYCNVCGLDPKYLEKHFVFVTYNYKVGNRLRNLEGNLVIIDEVHKLINGVKNRSKEAMIIYNKLMKCKKCRILALSGTPIFHYVFEWPLLGNLLKPGTFPDIFQGKKIEPSLFLDRYFKEDDDGTLISRNPTQFNKKLEGIISYYPGKGTEFYPEVIHMKPIKVQMSDEQLKAYLRAEEIEEDHKHPPNKKLLATDPVKYQRDMEFYIMTLKRIMTRSASNFYYPPDIKKQKDTLVKEGGWVEHDKFKNFKLVKLYSPKFATLLTNIALHNRQKHVVFSFFKTKAGVNLIQAMLKMCGIRSAIFSGDLSDSQREWILNRYNSKANRYGDKIRVLLVTEAGAEGITIKEARHLHILESSTRPNLLQQAIGRVVRYKSHYDLPKKEQNVQIWRYWSYVSLGKDKDEPGVDEQLYREGEKNINSMKSFMKFLHKASVLN